VFQVGPLEIALVAIIALIVLGPAKLPDAARAMGRGMREFKGALSGEDDEHEDEVVHEKKPAEPEPAARPADQV
jgi:sec-independent protein translocase protein TatA